MDLEFSIVLKGYSNASWIINATDINPFQIRFFIIMRDSATRMGLKLFFQ